MSDYRKIILAGILGVLLSGCVWNKADAIGGLARTETLLAAESSILQSKGKISVKQFGAIGDGVQNDFAAFEAALNSGASEIYVPAGSYELGGNILSVNSNITITGDDQNKCIIKNGCISTQYGISISNITFEGGAMQPIPFTGRKNDAGTVILLVSPNGKRSISYKNCTFKNATVASFARESAGSFESDKITGCTFSNINRVAIYHSLSIESGTYKNNVFSDIGGHDIITGPVSAIWIGDITNVTYVQAGSIVIKGNTFNNLITQDDFSGVSHRMNANFIAIRSDTAVINKNTINNLVGYGEDREAVYTKVRDLTVSNNTITEGGSGEGYICNKSQQGESYCKISGNILTGTVGCGIRNFAPGTITGNTINISNCSSVITNTHRSDCTSTKELRISGNNINSGTYTELNLRGNTVSDYSTGKAIRVSGINVPVIIEKNTFNPTAAFDYYITVGNPGYNVTIRDNNINAVDKTGKGIIVFSTQNGGKLSQNCKVVIERNKFKK